MGLHCAADDDDAVPFTLSSNLLAALNAGVARQNDQLLARIDADGRWIRQQLLALGLTLVAAEDESAGAVTTIALPPDAIDATRLGRALERKGFYTSYASGYLRQRNWLQICLMGEIRRPRLEPLLPVLAAQLDRMTRLPRPN